MAREVTRLEACADGSFLAEAGGETVRARRVLLATGGLDVEPDLPGVRDAVRHGLVRYCPICDAYEVVGQKVALIAYGKCRIREALLLRAYTADLTVLTLGRQMDMPDEERDAVERVGVRIVDEPVRELTVEGGRIVSWHMQGGALHCFDTIYSALGTRVRSELAVGLGAARTRTGRCSWTAISGPASLAFTRRATW